MLKAAERYIQLNLPVIPICSPDHGGETLTHRQICSYPGKVPVVENWQNRDATDEREVEKWYANHPKRNIGLPMGNVSRLIGVDVDGALGEQFLADLSGGDLPSTWEFSTGAGRRLLYRLPKGVRVKKFKKTETNRKHEELALLGDGQQTVIPPSTHVSGHKYEWVQGHSPFDMDEPAPAPQWMLNLMIDKHGQQAAKHVPTVMPEEWVGTVPEGQRQDRLKKLAGSLIGRGTIPKEEVLFFLRRWNEKHCVPPWPDEELIILVDNLAYAENAKKTSNNSKGKGDLRPTPFVKKFLQDQKSSGYTWRYCVKNGLFYRSDDAVGPWRLLDFQYVAKELRNALLAECDDWDTQHRVSECTSALKEELADPANDELFDIGANPNLTYICVENGLIDWKEGKLYPWDPDTFITTQLTVKYDPNAACPTWDEALRMWIPERQTREFLQEFIGLCMLPDTSFRTAVFLYGGGSNGKSLFIDGVSMIFGDTVNFTPLHRLADRFETAVLQNKLLNICGDIDPQFLKETGTLKAIISGDKIKGEYKHGRTFHFTPVARLMFSANELPKARDRSEGWYSRWGFVEFPRKFAQNSAYKKELLNALEAEKSGIFNWALAGLQRLLASNMFTTSDSMVGAKHQYTLENDNILSFLEERVEYGDTVQGILPTTYLYAYYKMYCDENGFRITTSREFNKQLRKIGIESASRPMPGNYRKRLNAFLNIRIVADFEREYNFITGCMASK